jgi:hypothetical protein
MPLDRSWFAAIVLTAGLWTTPAFAQVIDLAKYPDWPGQWNRVPDGGPPRYDPSKPLRKQKPRQARVSGAPRGKPARHQCGRCRPSTRHACMPMGMPRQMSISLMEFLFTPAVTYILYGDVTAHARRIYTDGRDFQEQPQEASRPSRAIPSVSGSIATARTLRHARIETRNIRGPRQWDQTGLPTADDNEAVIRNGSFSTRPIPTSRRDDHDRQFLTRPWTVMKNYRRHTQNITWEENN